MCVIQINFKYEANVGSQSVPLLREAKQPETDELGAGVVKKHPPQGIEITDLG